MLESWQREERASESPAQDSLGGPVVEASELHPSRAELQRKKEVEEALKLVDAAMKAAEGQLDTIPNLPSARLKRKVASWSSAWASPFAPTSQTYSGDIHDLI